MADTLFAALDIGLVFAVAFGLGLWQLVAVRRGLRRDREAKRGRPDGARDAGPDDQNALR